jgi:hypothetical protein
MVFPGMQKAKWIILVAVVIMMRTITVLKALQSILNCILHVLDGVADCDEGLPESGENLDQLFPAHWIPANL